MTRILYVDDDSIARRSMISRNCWEENNWSLIYCAKDAIDALEFMQKEQPDIMICDIKMPVMDGIQMAEIAKNYYPEIKLIFLSGFKEFEYAKKALKLNAIDYLTKPVDEEQLILVIREAEKASLIDVEQSRILNEKYPTVKRKYLTKLMLDDFKEIDDSFLELFDIKQENGYGIVGFIDIVPTGESESIFISSMLKSLCRKLLKEYEGSAFINLENNQIFFIYTISDITSVDAFNCSRKQMEKRVEELFNDVSHDAATIAFQYGSCIDSLNDLHKSYQDLLQITNSETNLLLRRVKKYLHDNYARPDITLTGIATHFCVNHCYLTSIFKDQFGISLYGYLINIRMEKAGIFAKTSDKKIYEIAEAVGYKNSQYFSISFKKHFGHTVSQHKI